jgi:hypothetical protein
LFYVILDLFLHNNQPSIILSCSEQLTGKFSYQLPKIAFILYVIQAVQKQCYSNCPICMYQFFLTTFFAHACTCACMSVFGWDVCVDLYIPQKPYDRIIPDLQNSEDCLK